MRLDRVEVKVSLGRDEVVKALRLLGLEEGGEPRKVGFVEDPTVGVDLPLFNHGIVLRVREVGGGDDDATVKLRPCRRSQLTERWLGADEGDGWKLRVEEDWPGSRRALAASCDADLPPGRIAAARAGTEPVHRLFAEGQQRFLAECAGIPVNLDALELLAPVAATRWDNVRIGDLDDVVAERWIVGDLDFLELSVKKRTVEKAQRAQDELEGRIRDLNLERDDEDKSKTERVLAHLLGMKL